MARRPATRGHAGTQAHRPTGGVGCRECERVPFRHSLAKPKPAWRDVFFYSFSPRTFPPETCAERSFLKSFSPHMSCLERQFADVTRGNLRKMAHNGHEGGAWSASLHTLPAKTCAKWHILPPLRGEKLETKLFSAHVSTRNLRGEKFFKKLLPTQVSASPGSAKKEPSHLSPPPTPPYAIPPPAPTTPACGHAGTWAHRSVFRFVWFFAGWPSMMATHGHHDGNPLPS